jgi:hypothetical protein
VDAESLGQIRQIVTETAQVLRQEIQEGLAATTQTLRQEIHEGLAETKRHTGVLIEDLHHKLDLVIEGQQFLRQQVQDVVTGRAPGETSAGY